MSWWCIKIAWCAKTFLFIGPYVYGHLCFTKCGFRLFNAWEHYICQHYDLLVILWIAGSTNKYRTNFTLSQSNKVLWKTLTSQQLLIQRRVQYCTYRPAILMCCMLEEFFDQSTSEHTTRISQNYSAQITFQSETTKLSMYSDIYSSKRLSW